MQFLTETTCHMSDRKFASSLELLPTASIGGWIATLLTRAGLRRRRLSITGQPILRLGLRHLALFDMTFDAVFVICAQGKVRGANAAAGKIFGGSFAAFEGLSAATFFRATAADDAPATFDPSHYVEPTRVTALGLDCRSFAAELRSSEIELNGAYHYLLCVREIT